MKIRMEDLPEEGQDYAFSLKDEWARTAVSTALEGPVTELEAEIHVLKVGRGVQVQGHALARVERTCDRCLAPVDLTVEGPLSLYYDVWEAEGEQERRLHADDLDVGFYDGVELDLSETLSEFFALEAPSRLFCDDDGVERREGGPCASPIAAPSEQDDVDPRLAVLKGFRPKEG